MLNRKKCWNPKHVTSIKLFIRQKTSSAFWCAEGICGAILYLMLYKRVNTHRTVVVFRANVTVLPAPVDLEESTAADLTHHLMSCLVHACPNKKTFEYLNLMWEAPWSLSLVDQSTFKHICQLLTIIRSVAISIFKLKSSYLADIECSPLKPTEGILCQQDRRGTGHS